MRYIRTKDGIYDTTTMSMNFINYNEIYRERISYSKQIDDNTIMTIYEKDIINQADTIEELCDEFVCGKNHLLLKLHELKHEVFKEDVKDIVYGAIWTDEGLIFIAKMNKKGELELL